MVSIGNRCFVSFDIDFLMWSIFLLFDIVEYFIWN